MTLNRRDFLKIAASGVGTALCSQPALALQRENLPLSPDAVGMLYDSTLCIGCKACMVACKDANNMPLEATDEPSLWDLPVETSGDTLNVIKLYKEGKGEHKDQESNGFAFMKRHCLHCVDPSCVSVCPVSAMTKDPVTGIVEHHEDRCIGCRYCVYSCPFGIPKYEYDEAFGQIQKCEFCTHLQAKGEIPACCDVCPTGATLFGKVSDLKQEASKRLEKAAGETHVFPRGKLGANRPPHEAEIPQYKQHVYGLNELGGTQIMYMSAVPFDKLGLPTNVPDYSYPSIAEGIQHTLYKWMIAPAILLSGLAFVVHKNTQHSHDDDDASGEGES
ncbi:MAG: hydrogenase 2 operon protein HybA [Gammaproteobacteria bacterium]